MAATPSLRDSDFPPLFHAADSGSLRAQSQFLWASAIRLIGIIAAAAFGLATWRFGAAPTDWAGVLAAICFGAAITVELYLLKIRPDRTWYEGRAAAESVRTLTWRYAVGGDPFPIGVRTDKETDALFLEQLTGILQVLKDLTLPPPAGAQAQITPPVRQLRAAPLDERKRVYEAARVADQQDWYQRKSHWNSRRARRWTLLMLAAEVAGISAAILKAIGFISVDLLTFAGTVVAAVSAWLQTRRYQSLATDYAITALELATVRTKIEWQATEAEWAKFVDVAEAAFSQEHSAWQASRASHSP